MFAFDNLSSQLTIPAAKHNHKHFLGSSNPNSLQFRLLKHNDVLKFIQGLQKIRIPPVLGLKVDMILGQRFANVHPKPIQTLLSRLTVYRSRLLPAVLGQVACIRGPIEAVDSLASIFHAQMVLNQLKNMCSNISSYVPRLDFFPEMRPEYVDVDITGVSELTPEVKGTEASKPSGVPAVNTWEPEEQGAEGSCKIEYESCSCTCLIQQELKKWLKMQELGLDTGYRCRVQKVFRLQERLWARENVDVTGS